MQVVVDENGDFVSGVKHMAAGRLAIELPYVMPDQQTVYITDDGTNVILGIYKLTTPGDLTCGTLWAAKADQTESVGGAHRQHLPCLPRPAFMRSTAARSCCVHWVCVSVALTARPPFSGSPVTAS